MKKKNTGYGWYVVFLPNTHQPFFGAKAFNKRDMRNLFRETFGRVPHGSRVERTGD
jgi:hypothetical protein